MVYHDINFRFKIIFMSSVNLFPNSFAFLVSDIIILLREHKRYSCQHRYSTWPDHDQIKYYLCWQPCSLNKMMISLAEIMIRSNTSCANSHGLSMRWWYPWLKLWSDQVLVVLHKLFQLDDDITDHETIRKQAYWTYNNNYHVIYQNIFPA